MASFVLFIYFFGWFLGYIFPLGLNIYLPVNQGKPKCSPRAILIIKLETEIKLRRALSLQMLLTLRTSSLVITCRWLSSSLPCTFGRATTGFWSLYSCKPACGRTWERPWEPACTLMASELCAPDHFAPEFLAVFLGLQATASNQPSPPRTMTRTTMKRRMTMMVTSVALLAILTPKYVSHTLPQSHPGFW